MQELIADIKSGRYTHHAFLFEGDPQEADHVYTVFGIDDAHEIARKQGFAREEPQHLVVGAFSITPEAQNALLKTLEEPVPGTVFIFIIASMQTLLPTLRSRFFELRKENEVLSTADIAAFMTMSPLARLAYLEKTLLKEEKGTEEKRRMRHEARAFISAIELWFAARRTDAVSSEWIQALQLVRQAKEYSGDSAAAIKLLLENLALHLPPWSTKQA